MTKEEFYKKCIELWEKYEVYVINDLMSSEKMDFDEEIEKLFRRYFSGVVNG